ncbi:hypothetical protein [Collimonas sp.]|jgi:hypothetical protein|nr:hypothetical protein [Collimonas sp.]HWW06803.1 hypothetical protein [Collimonas sp.]
MQAKQYDARLQSGNTSMAEPGQGRSKKISVLNPKTPFSFIQAE